MSSDSVSHEIAIWSLTIGIVTLLVGTAVSIGLYALGRRLDFRSRMRRWDELRSTTNTLFVEHRSELRDVILMNARRYEKDYNGGNDTNRHGSVIGKAELLGTRNNGIEVICNVVPTWVGSNGRRTLRKTAKPAGNAYEVGFVPFDYIEHINLSGDEYRAEPIFYVRYKGPGKAPYSSYTYQEGEGRHIGPSGRLYFDQITELGERRPGRLPAWVRFNLGRIRGAVIDRRTRNRYANRQRTAD